MNRSLSQTSLYSVYIIQPDLKHVDILATLHFEIFVYHIAFPRLGLLFDVVQFCEISVAAKTKKIDLCTATDWHVRAGYLIASLGDEFID